MAGILLERSSMSSHFGRLMLLNESISWTPDLIEPLRRDKDLVERITDGNQEDLSEFFKDHRTKMKNFLEFRRSLDPEKVEGILKNMTMGGVAFLDIYNDDYPERLREIEDPPLIIFHIGTLFDMSRCIAVSGTRTPSSRIKKMTFDLCSKLSEEGYTITSGLALGVDTEAHRGALSIDQGNSVAVMANGLDRVVPGSNLELAKKIALNGAVLSEKILKPDPTRYDFIRRNRIICGISGLQIIMQSSGSGGTEHQFNIAKSQGRTILVYEGEGLTEVSRKSARRMISKGGKGFSDHDEVSDLIKEYWGRRVCYSKRKDISLERWN